MAWLFHHACTTTSCLLYSRLSVPWNGRHFYLLTKHGRRCDIAPSYGRMLIIWYGLCVRGNCGITKDGRIPKGQRPASPDRHQPAYSSIGQGRGSSRGAMGTSPRKRPHRGPLMWGRDRRGDEQSTAAHSPALIGWVWGAKPIGPVQKSIAFRRRGGNRHCLSVAPTDSPQTIALSSRGHSPAPSARYSRRGSRKDGSIRFTRKCCKSDTGVARARHGRGVKGLGLSI